MIIYLIKCTITMGISWCIYRLFLADKKTFVFNRIYLLTAIIGSAVAPLISLPTFNGKVNIPYSIYNLSEFNTTNIVGSTQDIIVSEAIGMSDVITWILISLSLVLAIRFLYRIFALIRLSHATYPYYKDGLRIAVVNDKRTPFSFFNVIYVDQDSYSKGIDESIFLHEKYHIQAWHSLDRIIVESLSIFLWMNPFLHLLKRNLIDNHEYAADSYAIEQDIDTQNYLTILLSKSINSSRSNLLLHQFTHSSSLKRIKMLCNNQTNSNFWYRPLAFILLLGCLISCSDDIEDDIILNIPLEVNKSNTQSISAIDMSGLFKKVRDKELPPLPIGLPPFNQPPYRFFKTWLDKKFVIIIDDEQVNNRDLSKKSNEDFSYFSVRGIQVIEKKEHDSHEFTVRLISNEYYNQIKIRNDKRRKVYENVHPAVWDKFKDICEPKRIGH